MDPNQKPQPEGKVLLVDKPLEWTSFDVVKKIRNGSVYRKVGHAGTLDPLATGLLIICTGKKTKEIESFMGLEKEYDGTFVLGKTTPSVDLETPFDGEFPFDHISEEDLEQARSSFLGEQEQVPPHFSAVKVDGQRAYQLARKGEKSDLKVRKVIIREFDLDLSSFPEIWFRIICSKGTYIRSIVRDFGEALQSGAYLKSLRRTRIGDHRLEDALTIQETIERLKNEDP